MEKLVRELKKNIQFKDTTAPGDIVLVMVEEPQALFYALVVDIERDTAKKDEWWHVHLSILSIPPQPVVWTLREPQFTGREIFSMGGVGRFIQAVDFGGASAAGPDMGAAANAGKKGGGRPALKRVK